MEKQGKMWKEKEKEREKKNIRGRGELEDGDEFETDQKHEYKRRRAIGIHQEEWYITRKQDAGAEKGREE